jgi:hypothetical protein
VSEPTPRPRPEPRPDKPDDAPVIPRTTRDDTDEGWGERRRGNDERLLEDRPPHWGAD